jgi:hypothetical protein
MKHLKHVEHTLATCTNPVARHECLLVTVTACPLPQAIPLLLSAEGAAGASRRREAPCAGAAAATAHREEGEEEAMGGGGASSRGGRAAAHLAVGARTTTRGEPDGIRRCRWRRLCLLEEKKKGRKRNGGWLTLWENEASDFLCSLRTSESEHYRFQNHNNTFLSPVCHLFLKIRTTVCYLNE